VSCVLANNVAKENDGGAVAMWEASSMQFENVVIKTNKARYAGGIDVEAMSTLLMFATNLTNNTAVQSGGAVYAGMNGSMSATASVIAGNTAGADGGGVNAADAASLHVSHSVFSRNRAVGKGGALYLSGPAVNVNLQSCAFTRNDAEYGGAFQVDDHARALASACGFQNNRAGTTGGAIFTAGFGSVVLTEMTRGVGNRANFGGFFGLEADSRAEIAGGIFARNVASKDGKGGCVHALGNAVVVMSNSTIVGGVEQPGVSGGAYSLVENATLSVSSCNLAQLHADKGAGIYASDTSSVHARNCTVCDSTATSFGGGLFADTSGRITWVGGSFLRTSAEYGGAINVLHGNLSVAGTRFENCSSGNSGGGIYAELTADAALVNCTMRGCTAAEQVGGGGGAVLVTDTARVRLESCNMTQSRSIHGGGGALDVLEAASVQMQDCYLEQNQAANIGGAVVAEGSARLVAIRCVVTNNACGERGGCMAVTGNASVQLTACLLSGCSADSAGGMSLEDHAAVSMVDTYIVRNTAASFGGGVLLGSEQFALSQMQAAVRGNMAPAQPNLCAVPSKLTNKNSSTVWNYISRLRADEGVLHVVLLVTGPRRLPAAVVDVNALLDGVVLLKARSGDDGLVHFPVKLLKPPGALLHSLQSSWPAFFNYMQRAQCLNPSAHRPFFFCCICDI
jgi:hypothetical protein